MSDAMGNAITLVKAKRRRRPRRRSRGKKSTVAQVSTLSKRITALTKEVKSTTEVKSADAYVNATFIDNAGYLVDLTSIAQGVQQGQRVGDEIDVVGLDLRYRVYGVTATGLNMIRIIVFEDLQNNMTAGTILRSTGLLAPLSHYNREYRGRFKVHYDKMHTLDAYETQQDVQKVGIKKKFHLEYNPGTTTVRRGALRILVIGNQPAAGADRPYIEYASRVYYVDK